jgi:hypothetical protein
MVSDRARVVAVVALLASLCALGQPAIYSRLGANVIAVMNLLRDGTSLNDDDAERRVRGYYEELAHVERFDARLAQVYGIAPDETWDRPGRFVRRPTNDFRVKELMPSIDTVVKGAPFRTNRWGIRDREYAEQPPPGTCRLALLGQSHSAGGGIGDDKIFEALLAERLDRERAQLASPAVEILNFAQPAYTLLDQLLWIEKSRLFERAPAVLLYVAHPNEIDRVLDELIEVVHEQRPIPFDNVRRMVAQLDLSPSLDEAALRLRLRPIGGEILRWAYQQIGAQCRLHHVRPVWIFLPLVPRRVGDEPAPAVRDELFSAARGAGFQIVDLGDVYEHRDQKSLAQAPWDDHPNAFAHALIAARLHDALRESEKSAPLGVFSPLDEAHPDGCRP